MQTIMHPAFQEKLAVLAALLERSRTLRAETRLKIGAPRYQVASQGTVWSVVDMATGSVQGLAPSYQTALCLASAIETGFDDEYGRSKLKQAVQSKHQDYIYSK